MGRLIETIENTYLLRRDNHSLQKDTWRQVSCEYFPKLSPETGAIPSRIISSEAGDLGLAMLWIVQASLIRGMASDINSSTSEKGIPLPDKTPAPIGALAHNDDRENPVILAAGPVLNGAKRYITGGTTSDIIFVTAKEKPEDKISHLFALRTADIPAGSLTELDLGCLKTVSHGRLTLASYRPRADEIVSVDEKTLRRSIRRWSIIERSLILQSFIGLISYINDNVERETGSPIIGGKEIEAALQYADDTAAEQIAAAFRGGLIEEKNADFGRIMGFVQACNTFLEKNRHTLSENLRERFPDLNFMQKNRR